MSPVARAMVAVVLVAGAGPAGFLLYRMVLGHHHPGEQYVPAQTAPVLPPGSPASAPPGASSAPAPAAAVPERLPDYVLADSAGVRHRLSDYRGHPLALNFWATWCEPCRREIPLLKRLSVQHRAEGLQVVGVAVDFRADVLRYAHDMGIDYPVLMGEQDGLGLINALGMQTVFPFTVFADARGDIVTVKVGELHADEAALILARLQDVDAGRLPLNSARRDISEGMRELAIARAKQSQATVAKS